MQRPRGDVGRFGLCDSCVNAKLIRNTRGSVFLMCELSNVDEHYPKYPPVPIIACEGHRPPGDDAPRPSDD